jgi:O-antigen ligase
LDTELTNPFTFVPENTLTFRDRMLRDTFTIAERMVFITILFVAVATFIIGDTNSKWLQGTLIIVGMLTMFILKAHEQTHPFFVDLLWTKFWLITAPAWSFMLLYLIGLFQNPIQTIEIDGTTWSALVDHSRWVPITADASNTWASFFSFFAVYLLATLTFIVPKSRTFFESALPLLCTIATALGIFGLLQASFEANNVLFTNGTGRTDFFAFFPYDGHWAAFATLWCTVCVAMSLHGAYTNGTESYLNSRAPWFLAGATILGFSGLWIEARWPAICLLFTYAAMLLCVGLKFTRNKKDPDKFIITIGSFIAAMVAASAAVYRFVDTSTLTANTDQLYLAASELFKEQPLFGWGFNSFNKLLPFYGEGTLLLNHYQRAQSDVLQFASEFGLFGIVLIVALLGGLFVRYLKVSSKHPLSKYMLFGCIGLIGLSFVDTPFYSPAVFFSFWIILLSAIRWTDLNSNDADQVDARVVVVADESERKVPVFKGHHPEKLR